MADQPNPCPFAAEPLDRASIQRADGDWVQNQIDNPDNLMIPLHFGNPLITGGEPAFLSTAARAEFGQQAATVFLGRYNDTAYFAIDASTTPDPAAAPFADIGEYLPLRDVASTLSSNDLAMIGQGRWFLDWHHRHAFCAKCGNQTQFADGGAKRVCHTCETEHFPRTDPVAIVLATHEGSCLLGRSPHFPPGFLSALAGFIEAAETPEQCAIRELKEEAGVTLTDVRYQFSQPWPFPSSLMMGFIADAADRDLTLDETEIVEAKWISKEEINQLRKIDDANMSETDDIRLPPSFTIARQLIERWADTE